MSTIRPRIDEDPDDIRHGTLNGYVNLRCRCQRCRDRWSAYQGPITRNRRACGLPDDDPRHGTENGYGNYGCRCPRCRLARHIVRYGAPAGHEEAPQVAA